MSFFGTGPAFGCPVCPIDELTKVPVEIDRQLGGQFTWNSVEDCDGHGKCLEIV